MPDLRLIDPDARFFEKFPTRKFHIRPAHREEYNAQFLSLGPHKVDRRVVIMAKVDPLAARQIGGPVMKVPMLLNADESISDDDAVLGKIWHEVMTQAAEDYGMNPYEH